MARCVTVCALINLGLGAFILLLLDGGALLFCFPAPLE